MAYTIGRRGELDDIVNILCLDPKQTRSPFDKCPNKFSSSHIDKDSSHTQLDSTTYIGQHRTILIGKDFTNHSDFAFNLLVQHFTKKDPKTPILFFCLEHTWKHYTAWAARCGVNFRTVDNDGSIEVASFIDYIGQKISKGEAQSIAPMDFIIDRVNNFLDRHTLGAPVDPDTRQAKPGTRFKPVVIALDNLIHLNMLGAENADLYRIFSRIDGELRDRTSQFYMEGQTSHFICQLSRRTSHVEHPIKDGCLHDVNFCFASLENLCDICIKFAPLESGFSHLIDGSILINDYRFIEPPVIPRSQTEAHTILNPIMKESLGLVGKTKTYFYKQEGRKVRLIKKASFTSKAT